MSRPRSLLDNPHPRGSAEYHRCRYAQMSPEQKEAERAEARRFRTTIPGRAQRLWHGARARAARAGIEFDLPYEWVLERMEKGVCEVSGLPFVLVEGRHAFAPSLDRNDPKKGYTTDNVRMTLWCYNAAKGVSTDEQVLTLAQALCTRAKS